MKVKIFRFQVSNASYLNDREDDKTSRWYSNNSKELVKENEIETIINDFIEDKNVVEIKVTTIDVLYHNNARSNTIELIYTIMYDGGKYYAFTE
jgi:hypothetical protein